MVSHVFCVLLFKCDKDAGHAEGCVCAPVRTAAEELPLTDVIQIVLAVRLGSATFEDIFLTVGSETTTCKAELLESCVKLRLACSCVEHLHSTGGISVKLRLYSKCLVEVFD